MHELARRYELHPHQIIALKKQLQSGVADLFGKEKVKDFVDLELENQRFDEKIGRLKMERDWF
ncbi:MAG: hypothetical protein AAFY71_27955 [Bacteroidota bacterium]